MTGYTHFWTCLICKQRVESIDRAKPEVCDDCIRPVAAKLCHEALKKPLNTPGVDAPFWMQRANEIVERLFLRYKWTIPDPKKPC